jgi:flagellar biosynthetic protein FliR
MSFDISATWLLAVVLVTIRMGILLYATPFDGMGRLPAQIRVYASFLFAVMLVTGLDIEALSMPQSIFELAMLALQEAFIGLVMAFGIYCVFGSIMVGGKLIDFQAGFGAAQILNPATNTSSPLMGTVFSLLATMLFFLSDAHLLALKGIAYSLEISPPGSGMSALPIDAILKQFGVVYLYGFIIAAPVIGILLLLDTSIAVMGRTMPQMNVYFLFLPLKIGVALGLSAIAVRYLSPLLERMFLGIFQYWQRAL